MEGALMCKQNVFNTVFCCQWTANVSTFSFPFLFPYLAWLQYYDPRVFVALFLLFFRINAFKLNLWTESTESLSTLINSIFIIINKKKLWIQTKKYSLKYCKILFNNNIIHFISAILNICIYFCLLWFIQIISWSLDISSCNSANIINLLTQNQLSLFKPMITLF